MMTIRLSTIVLVCAAALSTCYAMTKEEAALEPYTPPLSIEEHKYGFSESKILEITNVLADCVYDKHTVKSPVFMTYGMIYEFYKDGRRTREFGLDSMHDGLWFVNGMIAAHRIRPEANYLERPLKYQFPFYTNMTNNSDVIFPRKPSGKPGQDNRKPDPATKGWIPRGWDEGIGYHMDGKLYDGTHPNLQKEKITILFKDGKFHYAYDYPSNHLAQDLADMFTNAWMTLRNPALREAARNVNQYRLDYYGRIGSIDIPVRYISDDKNDFPDNPGLDVADSVRFSFGGNSQDRYYNGLFLGERKIFPVYNDPLAFAYRRATIYSVRTGNPFPARFAWGAAWQVYGASTLMEYLYDTEPCPLGMQLWHRLQHYYPIENGKITKYVSDGNIFLGTRGIQFSWIGAAVLPVLKAHPEVWEEPYRTKYSDEPLIRMVDTPPTTDGKKDTIYSASETVRASDGNLSLISDPKNLHLFIESEGEDVELTFSHSDPRIENPTEATIEISKDGSIRAYNDKGEDLLFDSAFTKGRKWSAELRIPYTVISAQKHWINGVDHGRYEVGINGQKQIVYLVSTPERIINRIENLSEATIRSWHHVMSLHNNMLPGVIYSDDMTRIQDGVQSELGGIAHMILNNSMVLINRAGTSEWDLMKKQFPEKPHPIPALPDSVLKAQGQKTD